MMPLTLDDVAPAEVVVLLDRPAPTGTSRFEAYWIGREYDRRTGAPRPALHHARLQAPLSDYKRAAALDGLSVRITPWR